MSPAINIYIPPYKTFGKYIYILGIYIYILGSKIDDQGCKLMTSLTCMKKGNLISDDFMICILETLFFEGELTPYQLEKKAGISHVTAHKKIKKALNENLIQVKGEKVFRTGLLSRTLSITDEGLEYLFIYGKIERKHFERLKALIESNAVSWKVALFFIGDPLLEKAFQHWYLPEWGSSEYGLMEFLYEASFTQGLIRRTYYEFVERMKELGLEDKVNEIVHKLWVRAMADEEFVEFFASFLNSMEGSLKEELRYVEKMKGWLASKPTQSP